MALIHPDDRFFTHVAPARARKSREPLHPGLCFATGIALMFIAGLAVHVVFNAIIALPLFRGG